MSRLAKSILIVVVAMGALLLEACSRPPSPQASCNFVQNPETQQRVAWKSKFPVNLYLHESVPQETFATFDEAIKQYNEKVGHGQELFRIVARGVSGDMNPTKDGYSTIYWFKTWDPARKTEQARTTIYWMGNEIFEADMRINAADFRYSLGENTDLTEVDLMSLITHELGHVLGLAHNPTHGSVMNFSLDQGQNRRVLGSVDLASLKCEY